jgi:hypothetical protein
MATLDSALKLLTPGCYMTSLDLNNAYYSVPIARDRQRYLKFIWKDQIYHFTYLPMGLTSSPRIFTKLLKPAFAWLRAREGISCSGYIDDSIYLEDTYNGSAENTLRAVNLLLSLGFAIHAQKLVV